MRLKIPLFCLIVCLWGCTDDEGETPTVGTGDLEVYVHFEDGPYPDAVVTVVSLNKSLTTDTTGTVVFEKLDEGTYDIEVLLPDSSDLSYDATGTVKENQKIRVDVPVGIAPPPPLVDTGDTLDLSLFLDKAYSSLSDIFGFGKYVYYWGDIGTDIVYINPVVSPSYGPLDRYSIAADNQVVYGVYLNHYQLINEVNMGLDRIKSGSHAPISDADKIVIEAEFRFLRALAYFNVVKIYGNPILTTTTETDIDSPSDLVQDPNRVYEVIQDDLIFAKENLPESGPTTKASTGAAQALLGKVYMKMAGFPMLQTDKYALALQEFKALEGQYMLEPEYADVFNQDNGTTSGEVIFRVDLDAGQSNSENAYGISWGPLGVAGSDGLLLVPSFLASYTNDKTGFEESVSFPLDIADERFKSNIAVFVLADGTVEDTTQVSSWRPLKFTSKNKLTEGFQNASVDFPYLRYADVLLLKAEAENEVNGPTPLAYDAINTVRRRAFKNEQNDISPGLDKQQFFEAVSEERKLELCYEGHRKDDLVRTQLLEKSVNEFNLNNTNVSKDYQPHEYIWPIPQQELDLIPNAAQNPGY